MDPRLWRTHGAAMSLSRWTTVLVGQGTKGNFLNRTDGRDIVMFPPAARGGFRPWKSVLDGDEGDA